MVVIVVMLVGLLTFIICSELSYDDKNEEIFRDFFRFFRKIDPHSDDIALTLFLKRKPAMTIPFVNDVFGSIMGVVVNGSVN